MVLSIEAKKKYQTWLTYEGLDEETRHELKQISDRPTEIEERFYKELEFGTGGLRGVIGAGTNRINRYTIGRASQGFATYILEQSIHERSIVIAFDSRHQSAELALETAQVFAANGIVAYLFESLRPTPELSYAVRELQAAGGIVITASHNPPEYNGYKVYGADGGQLVPTEAWKVTQQIEQLTSFAHVKRMTKQEAEDQRLIRWLGTDLDNRYVAAVTAVSPRSSHLQQANKQLRIVYTPLHGAGNHLVRQTLHSAGFTDVIVVPEQEHPDPNFSTVVSPNPEEREAFALALPLAEQTQADLVVGTDPDCDRMGAIVRDRSGNYEALSGNQAGAIIVHYLLESMQAYGSLPSNGVVIKTIVTSELGAEIARHYGVHTLDTLTGFKYIGEKMTEFEQNGKYEFLFGYEESYGYLAGTYCRDKDAVLAAMLICEAAAYYKQQGKTLLDVLTELYEKHGYYMEKLESVTLKGKEGLEKIQHTMDRWRHNPPEHIAGIRITVVEDYIHGLNGLPAENVLKYKLEDGSWFCLRPSGTEPKLKIYFGVCANTKERSVQRLAQLSQEVLAKG